ncbi:hypothetical protein DFH09DRAFT_934621, partial [Mycena vulgaris]
LPDVQRKAQAEIDSVTGGTRIPLFRDRDQLPYVTEVFRWHCVAPLGNDMAHLSWVPHAALEDTIVNSHLIPKGTIQGYP